MIQVTFFYTYRRKSDDIAKNICYDYQTYFMIFVFQPVKKKLPHHDFSIVNATASFASLIYKYKSFTSRIVLISANDYAILM